MSSLEPFRFLRTLDLHLDSPVEGLSSEAPPEVLALLRGATTDAGRAAAAADAVRDLATRHQVIDFTCHAATADGLDPGGERTVALA